MIGYRIGVVLMLLEKAVKMSSQLFTMVLFARFLSVEDMGGLTLAYALMSLFFFLNIFGLDTIFVKRVVNSTRFKCQYLYAALSVRVIFAIACVVSVNILGFLFVPDDYRFTLLILSLYHLFMPVTVFEWYFQALGRSEIAAVALIIGHLCGLAFRLVLLYFDLFLVEYIAIAYSVELIGTALIFLVTSRKIVSANIAPASIRFTLALSRSALPLVLSSALVMLYMKADQLMLGSMSAIESVAIYVSATRLSEAWFVIGVTIIGVLYPKVLVTLNTEGRDAYLDELTRIGSWLVLLGVSIALVTMLIGQELILVLYGAKFLESVQVLLITIWVVPFVYLGAISTKMYVAKGMAYAVLYRGGAGLSLNLLLNFLLIPECGAVGAALSTLISQIIASYLFNCLSSYKDAFNVQTKSLMMRGLFK